MPTMNAKMQPDSSVDEGSENSDGTDQTRTGDVARAAAGSQDAHGAVSELPVTELDDLEHREELRGRYYGLLEELRLVLPGAQVLVAFLLIAPFSQRFEELDRVGLNSYLVALLSSALATVCLITPTAYHRAGGRTARASRLKWSVRTTRAGLVLLALGLTAAMFCVTRFVFDNTLAATISAGLLVTITAMWGALPVLTGRRAA